MQRLPTAHGVFRAEPLPDGWQLPYGSYPRAQSLQGPKDLRRRVEHSQLKIPTGSEDVRLPIAFQGRAGQSVRKPPSSAMVTLIKRPKKANSRVD